MKPFYRTPLGEKVYIFVIYLLITLLCLSIVLPFLNILALSFNAGKDAERGGIYFWPRVWSIQNFKEVFASSNIVTAFGISLFRTVVGTVASVFLTAMGAYALKSRTMPGVRFFTLLIFFTMLFSGGMIPYYMLLKSLHLTNTIWVYIIPSLYSAWNLIIMRTFFQQIHPSLEESARMDGYNDFAIFMRIIMPLSKPVIAVIALFNAVGHWNDWFTGAFYVRSAKLRPLSTLLQEMLTRAEAMRSKLESAAGMNQYDALEKMQVTGDSMKMATIIIVVAPIIIIYPFIQKYFAQGVMIGSIKE
ncbi:carbohydrate ABC transporter permease [Paenibacillus favisporus]|uniref:carbohydrate ABC transporter permease n=1 Tax=Paenibacillus TaxID=44249 RepID=UPI000E23F122|nr:MULTISPECIES: carbohydrate ABC transporter permease [Paenibacillus]MBJ9987364.1 carbohydrate ABC transporter permease [Paenibacillus sp. S28]MCM2998047.1 carbohydrate ABC transporter permease [Paenibacillus cellulositrophicus]MEC0173932.1 carbohydrate ABC transporter permease [Paenibacillus favisporus]RED40781.1 carbohydrate ABC transporter membrane protein 2 (CUT1 family) [Paenibacillus sp. VMFN-D1]